MAGGNVETIRFYQRKGLPLDPFCVTNLGPIAADVPHLQAESIPDCSLVAVASKGGAVAHIDYCRPPAVRRLPGQSMRLRAPGDGARSAYVRQRTDRYAWMALV